MKSSIIILTAANLMLLVMAALGSTTTRGSISLSSPTATVLGARTSHKAERLLRQKFKKDVLLIISNYQSVAGDLIKKHNHNLKMLLKHPLGESAQLETIKDWGNASLEALRTKLSDASADMKDAVKKFWEDREGPIRRRRNPFDGSSRKRHTADTDRRDFARGRVGLGLYEGRDAGDL